MFAKKKYINRNKNLNNNNKNNTTKDVQQEFNESFSEKTKNADQSSVKDEILEQKETNTPEENKTDNTKKSYQEELEELKKKLNEAEDRFLRSRADFDNYRKRVQKDISEIRIASRIDTLFPILSVFDHFKLAVEASEKTSDFKVLHDGIKIILSEFKKAMNDLEIETIDACGTVFNPLLHEAISEEFSDSFPENVVISQWRCGYKMADKIIRPCSVVVSKGPHKNENPSIQNNTQSEKNEQN